MIPSYDVDLSVHLPDGAGYGYPKKSEISEEGFGFFRGTWFLGRPTLRVARELIHVEAEIVCLLDVTAHDSAEYELLAGAVEGRLDDPADLPDGVSVGPLASYIPGGEDDIPPLDGLEVGVAGLTYALSAVGFLTAASCRAHDVRSWSDCPVVFFGAHQWRAEMLVNLAQECGCGIGQARGMLTVYSRSVPALMRLAQAVVDHAVDFRHNPDPRRRLPTGQLSLPLDD